MTLPSSSWFQSSTRFCRRWGIAEQRLTTLLYTGLNIAVFSVGFCSNLHGGFNASWAFPMAKGGGYAMDLNFAMLVLPTLKSLQTAMRRVSTSREWVPIDDPISFHVTVACFIVLGSMLHIAGHVVHMFSIRSAPVMQQDPLHLWKLSFDEQISGMTFFDQFFNLRSQLAPVTGVVLTFMMAAIVLTALPCARRGTNRLTRRIAGFNVFWRVHMSWKWLYVCLLLHAPARLWIWLFFPAILITIDRLLLATHQSLYLSLRRATLLSRDVLALTFDVPQGFVYQAGQYILLGWKGEWHPFTLTSAPEEGVISVHIRAPANLDWCSALRRRLTEEAPAQLVGGAEDEKKKPKPGTVIEYQKHVHANSRVIYNMPKVSPADPEQVKLVCDEAQPQCADTQPKLLGRVNSNRLRNSAARSGETIVSTVRQEQLPPGAVVLQVTGPFGAPAQKVWGFDTLMVVGAGIGVTPFASIMKSVQLRCKQRETILKAVTAKPSAWRSRQPVQVEIGNLPGGEGTSMEPGIEKLLDEMVVIPKRIYFYWICRGQEEFDWFYDLLHDAADGPAAGIIDITLFLTGEVELSQVKKLPCASGQFFGRPNWQRIFKQNRDRHKGEHVGVFLCGSPVIGEELARQSEKHSDFPGTPGCTRFSFFKEHF